MSRHLILGGARSGKSRLAESLAQAHGGPVCVIATAQPLDDEMVRRIARHRLDRPARWRTVEEPWALTEALRREARPDGVLLVDCLTLWLTNVLGEADETALANWQAAQAGLLACLPGLPGLTLLVANELGLGLVPETPLGRLFRDEAGRLNQALAACCERVSLVVAGLPMCLKGATLAR